MPSMQMSRQMAIGGRGYGVGGRKGGTWRLRRTGRGEEGVERSLAWAVSSRMSRRMERESRP